MKNMLMLTLGLSLILVPTACKKDKADPAQAPRLVKTSTAFDVTETSAKVSSSLEADGASTITDHGHVYSETNGTPSIESDAKTSNGSFSGKFPAEFTTTLTGLKANTTYHARPYATNSVGTAYGDVIDVKTILATSAAAFESTNTIENLTTSSFKATSTISSNGNTPITQHGHVYGTNKTPTLDNAEKTSKGANDGPFPAKFSSDIASLKANTTYYVRPYATNDKGTVYGGETEVKTTLDTQPPTLDKTNTSENVTINSFKVTSTINSNGNASITQHGHVYSPTDKNPTTTSPNTQLKANDGPFPAKFSSELSKLTDNTTYYVRPYAINEKGTSYGEVLAVKTGAASLPILASNTVLMSLQPNSLKVGNFINSDGGLPITEHGHVISSTNKIPTILDRKTTYLASSGTFPRRFESEFNGLAELTNYYVRAYATNAKGTTYGTVVPLTTTEAFPTFSKPASFEDMRIYSLELIVRTAKTSDANTDDRVTVKFNDAMTKYHLDLAKDDREKGQMEIYHIVDDKIKTIRDLKYLTLEKEGTDGWTTDFVSIKVNGYQIYYNNMEANPFTIDGDDGYKPSVTWNNLRGSAWSFATNQMMYIPERSLTQTELERRFEGMMGNAMRSLSIKNVEWQKKSRPVEVTYKNASQMNVRVYLKNNGSNTTLDFILAAPCVSGFIQFKMLSPSGSIQSYFNFGNLEADLATQLNLSLNTKTCKVKFKVDGSIDYW